jgi:hypothetical protein
MRHFKAETRPFLIHLKLSSEKRVKILRPQLLEQIQSQATIPMRPNLQNKKPPHIRSPAAGIDKRWLPEDQEDETTQARSRSTIAMRLSAPFLQKNKRGSSPKTRGDSRSTPPQSPLMMSNRRNPGEPGS